MATKLTTHQRAQIVELRRAGKSFREIAKTVGVGAATVARLLDPNEPGSKHTHPTPADSEPDTELLPESDDEPPPVSLPTVSLPTDADRRRAGWRSHEHVLAARPALPPGTPPDVAYDGSRDLQRTYQGQYGSSGLLDRLLSGGGRCI